MARILGLILLLVSQSILAQQHGNTCVVGTYDTEPECDARALVYYGGNGVKVGYGTCGGTQLHSVIYSYNGSLGHCGVRHPQPQCEAGDLYWSSTSPDSGDEACSDGCKVTWTGWGVGGSYQWRTTGETCQSGGDDMEPDDDECHSLAGGFKWCPGDPDFCVRAPNGGLLCPSTDSQDCRANPSGILCHAKDPPPEDWDKKPNFDYCRNNVCVIFRPGTPKDDDDEDDDDEDNPDCPADDPDCEEDDDDDAPRASDSGCETETPSCSDMGHVDCQILIRTHRTKCEVAHSNKMLEEFRDKQIEEVRETNAKLKAVKETLEENNKSVLESLEKKIAYEIKQTNEKLRDVQSSTDNVDSSVKSVKTAITANTSATTDQTAALGSKLDGIKSAIQALPGAGGDGGGDGESGPYVLELGDTPGGGDGQTADDTAATGITTINIGPHQLDQAGYLGGGSCPVFPTFSLGGMPWTIDGTLWCQFLSIVNGVLMIVGAVVAGRILMET